MFVRRIILEQRKWVVYPTLVMVAIHSMLKKNIKSKIAHDGKEKEGINTSQNFGACARKSFKKIINNGMSVISGQADFVPATFILLLHQLLNSYAERYNNQNCFIIGEKHILPIAIHWN